MNNLEEKRIRNSNKKGLFVHLVQTLKQQFTQSIRIEKG